MPSPKATLRWLLFSPVPSQTTFESFGSTVTAPSEYEAWSSKIAVQVLPRFSVFQRLPEAAAMYQTLGFFGSTATSEMRPVVRLGPEAAKGDRLHRLGSQRRGARLGGEGGGGEGAGGEQQRARRNVRASHDDG